MAAITWDDVVDFAPELATYPVAAQDTILAHVNTTLDPDLLGGEESPKLKLARITLAAHMATLFTQANTGKVGSVVSEGLGPQKREYSGPDELTSDDALGLTGYGIQHRNLIRTSAARAPIYV